MGFLSSGSFRSQRMKGTGKSDRTSDTVHSTEEDAATLANCSHLSRGSSGSASSHRSPSSSSTITSTDLLHHQKQEEIQRSRSQPGFSHSQRRSRPAHNGNARESFPSHDHVHPGSAELPEFCPCHPFIPLKVNKKTGGWKKLFDVCPLCAALDDHGKMPPSISINHEGDSPSPAAVSKQHKGGMQTLRKRDLSLSLPPTPTTSGLPHCERRDESDENVGHLDQSHSRDASQVDVKRLPNYVKMALKISELADENARLRTRCENLEGDLASSLNSAQADFGVSSVALQLENHELHQMMEEMFKNQLGINKKTENFVKANEERAYHYEEKLVALRDELVNTRLEVHGLKQENKVLRTALNDAGDAEEYYEKELADLTAEKEGVCSEREEAYMACEVMQEEIDMLRRQLQEKPEGHGDSLTSLDETSSSSETSLSEKSLNVTSLPSHVALPPSDNPKGGGLQTSLEHISSNINERSTLRQYSISNDTLSVRSVFPDDRATNLHMATSENDSVTRVQRRKPGRKYERN